MLRCIGYTIKAIVLRVSENLTQLTRDQAMHVICLEDKAEICTIVALPQSVEECLVIVSSITVWCLRSTSSEIKRR